MKYSKTIKASMVTKLTESLNKKTSQDASKELYLDLDNRCKVSKITPYSFFEQGGLKSTIASEEGLVFSKCLNNITNNIEKDFNKGRKLVRTINDLLKEYSCYMHTYIDTVDKFSVMLGVFFRYAFVGDSGEVIELNNCLKYWKAYISSLFFIELINGTNKADYLLSLFIENDTDTLLDRVIEYGVMYDE